MYDDGVGVCEGTGEDETGRVAVRRDQRDESGRETERYMEEEMEGGGIGRDDSEV